MKRAVSGRAVCVGLFAVAVLCWWTPYNNYHINATLLGGNQFPIYALTVLLFLSLIVGPISRRFTPRSAWSAGELLTVWTMVLAASGIPSSGMMRVFIPAIPAPAYFSDSRNDWQAKLWGGLPAWLFLQDTNAAKAFYTGYPSGEEHIPWGAWAVPLLAWGLYAVFFLGATFFAAAILRRQWIENEKFAFPLVALPVQIAEEPEAGHLFAPLFRQPLLWAGVTVSFALHTLNGLHRLYPALPEVPTQWNLLDFFTVAPWNQLDRFEASIFLLVIGFAFLLPSEVCFSLWFFFLLYKAEILIGAMSNADMPFSLGGYSNKLFHALQAFGGCVALVGWTLWAARHHLRAVWEKATRGPRAHEIDDTNEMIGYRAAFWGLAVCYAGMTGWLLLADVPLVLALWSQVAVTFTFVVIGWIVCQAGMLFMAMPYATIDVLAPTFGTAPFRVPSLYVLHRAENAFIYNTRELLLPALVNSEKAADEARIAPRRLLFALLAAVGVALLVSVCAALWLPYYNGGGNAQAERWTYNIGPLLPLKFYGSAASVPYLGSPVNVLHIVGGFFGTALLLFLRARFGLPLHPIGFLGASTHAVHSLWFSIFLGWAIKSVIQRYGGLRGFRAALPFFFGLIIGDSVNGMIWTVLGWKTGVGYNILPV